MAKIQLPLLGVSATGQIGKSVVYFNWKGLNVARRYVIPANPKSSAQQVQRSIFTEAVRAFQNANFTEADRTAWNTEANLVPKPQSGFNLFIQYYIAANQAGKDFTTIRDVQVSNITNNTATVTGRIISDKTSKLYWGTSKTSLANEVTGTYSNETITFNLTNLPAGTNIYFKLFNTATTDMGTTGIYSFRTTNI